MKRAHLDCKIRYKIIRGIAQEILYLHGYQHAKANEYNCACSDTKKAIKKVRN